MSMQTSLRCSLDSLGSANSRRANYCRTFDSQGKLSS